MLQILSQAEVASGLPTLRQNLRDSEATIHQYAVSTLDHAREFGDPRGCIALLNVLPNGTRAEGLAAWYRNFSSKKLTLKRGSSRVWEGEIKKDRTDADFLIEAAKEITFADYTNEPSSQPVTMAKLFTMVERIANNDKTLPNGNPKVPEEVRAVAAKMVSVARAA